MRVMSFRWRDKEGYGVVADGGVIDVSSAFADRYPSLRSVIEADAMAEIEAWAAGREVRVTEGQQWSFEAIRKPLVFGTGSGLYGNHIFSV